MLWVILVLVVVAWLTWLLMPQQEPGGTASVLEQITVGLLRLREKLRPAARASSRGVERAAGWLGRTGAAGRRRSARPRLAVRPRAGWRSRLIALLQLILFVVLVGALFAGVFAAAALRFTHSGA